MCVKKQQNVKQVVLKISAKIIEIL